MYMMRSIVRQLLVVINRSINFVLMTKFTHQSKFVEEILVRILNLAGLLWEGGTVKISIILALPNKSCSVKEQRFIVIHIVI